MSPPTRWTLGLAWLALLSVQVSDSVQITALHMPAVVEHNTNSTAVLDCQYALGDEPPDRVRLVTVKWYLEGRQVYQWLWGTDRPSAQGLLKGRLNLDHTASPEELMKHRAISIANPTTELGGRYTCTVSTDQGQDSRSKTMIVYAPARTMNLTEDKPSPTAVNVSCLVEGVYPAPKLQLFATRQGDTDSRRSLDDVTAWSEETEDSLFDAMVHATIEDSSLEGDTEFECVLSVPGTSYTEERSITYSSGAVLAASKEKGAASRSVVLSSGLLAACLLLVISLRR